MESLMPIVVGCMYAAGFYLMLRRTLGQLIIGLAILTNGANLLIFSAAGMSSTPPIVPEGSNVVAEGAADSVPQALVLTAIVIGFGILAFFIVLAYRAYRSTGTDNLRRFTTTDRLTYGEKPPREQPLKVEPAGRPRAIPEKERR